jgi:hypothetical protein
MAIKVTDYGRILLSNQTNSLFTAIWNQVNDDEAYHSLIFHIDSIPDLICLSENTGSIAHILRPFLS